MAETQGDFGCVQSEVAAGLAGQNAVQAAGRGSRNQGWGLRSGSSMLLFVCTGLKKSLRESGWYTERKEKHGTQP